MATESFNSYSTGVAIKVITVALLLASSLQGSMANSDTSMMRKMKMKMNHNMTKDGWGWGGPHWGLGPWPGYNSSHCPFSHGNRTRGPSRIVVGGSNNWNFGFNYTDWALKNGPFYLNNVLVFKYQPPVKGSPGHSVYLLPDFSSYLKCDLSRAKRIASPTQGGGKGFEFKLTKWRPHYFACGEHNDIHCNLGMMKFFVMPIFRY
ncbi:hypothetical protein Cgig2_032442 [Carnegiea gigantea]|uniref:Phytocyanin domain-containing protein n=1 Tax=Carnegiea gigantea TaxID=171969 RepID=A0A9Q1KWF0_9CARY|nr:hypothetical protein Cgig2_032442 [Carnegiea gigantea]